MEVPGWTLCAAVVAVVVALSDRLVYACLIDSLVNPLLNGQL